MIRHLLMPNRVAGTEKFVCWVAANLPKSTYIDIMHRHHAVWYAQGKDRAAEKLVSRDTINPRS